MSRWNSNMTIAITAVWISAIAAVNSELDENQASTIAGVMTLESRTHEENGSTEFSNTRDEDKQPGREQSRPQQRRGDRAQTVDPRGAADLPALIQALVQLHRNT